MWGKRPRCRKPGPPQAGELPLRRPCAATSVPHLRGGSLAALLLLLRVVCCAREDRGHTMNDIGTAGCSCHHWLERDAENICIVDLAKRDTLAYAPVTRQTRLWWQQAPVLMDWIFEYLGRDR